MTPSDRSEAIRRAQDGALKAANEGRWDHARSFLETREKLMGQAHLAAVDSVEPFGSGPWKLGDEYLPYHPSASHIEPAYRDGWNRCYYATKQAAAEAASFDPEVLHDLALNYRTAQFVGEAKAAWMFLEAHVANLVEAAVTRERDWCLRLVLAEHLDDPTDSADDLAYDNAVRDCANAIRRLP